jgi:hypothetical protein
MVISLYFIYLAKMP